MTTEKEAPPAGEGTVLSLDEDLRLAATVGNPTEKRIAIELQRLRNRLQREAERRAEVEAKAALSDRIRYFEENGCDWPDLAAIVQDYDDLRAKLAAAEGALSVEMGAHEFCRDNWKALEAAARDASRWLGDPNDPNATFEDIATWFQSETGFMRPGKSLPIEMGDQDRERKSAWDAWAEKKNVTVRENLRRALLPAGAAPPPDELSRGGGKDGGV